MQLRTLVFSFVLPAVVVLIGVNNLFSAEQGHLIPSTASGSTGDRFPAPLPVPPPDSKDGYSDAAEALLGSNPAEAANRPSGASYQYDALGRIQEIVRVPSR
jgi:hypothetical protein